MRRIAITGAAGFIGRQVPRHLRAAGFDGDIRLFDRAFDQPGPDETIVLDLSAPGAIARVLDGADCVIHLAALPGGAAERDPVSSRAINLDVPLSLLEGLQGRRIVLASSIAVFGGTLPDLVSDETVPVPGSVYGTHKRMAELAFADSCRRGALTGFCLRLPGIVARPANAAGFGSAFLSEIFHASREKRQYTVPVMPDATSWLMSVDTCARNLAHAALAERSSRKPLTLPCLTVRIGELAQRLGAKVDYREDSRLREVFASYPPLETPLAESLGFRSDNSLDELIDKVFANG